MTGRSAACSYLAGLGIRRGNGSSQRAVFNTTVLKTVRRQSRPDNTALVLQNIWGIECFAGSLLAMWLRAVLWQDLPNRSLVYKC